MRFTISAEHRDFFIKNHFIELETLISPQQIEALYKHAEETVAKRLRLPVHQLKARPAPEIYQAGYDLWRDCEPIKKIAHKQSFAEIACDLMQTMPLRYGFDQYFAMTKCTVSPYDVPSSLQEISCLSPLAGAMIVPLQDLSSPPSFFPMPLKKGNVLFISPTFSLPWPQLFSTPELCFFMIAFAMEKTCFRADSHDPHAVSLKKLGYVFNDLLSDKLHPILLRKNLL